jgi:hypothetical protein
MSEYTGLSAASGDESSKFAALEAQTRHLSGLARTYAKMADHVQAAACKVGKGHELFNETRRGHIVDELRAARQCVQEMCAINDLTGEIAHAQSLVAAAVAVPEIEVVKGGAGNSSKGYAVPSAHGQVPVRDAEREREQGYRVLWEKMCEHPQKGDQLLEVRQYPEDDPRGKYQEWYNHVRVQVLSKDDIKKKYPEVKLEDEDSEDVYTQIADLWRKVRLCARSWLSGN